LVSRRGKKAPVRKPGFLEARGRKRPLTGRTKSARKFLQCNGQLLALDARLTSDRPLVARWRRRVLNRSSPGAPTSCEPFRLATTSYGGYFFALWWTRSMISLMATAHISPHSANIAIHVACGSAALCLGLIAILSRKGGPTHIRAGRLFIYSYGIVVATAVIGLAIFEFRSFLAVVTLLSLYDVFAGYRALQLRGRRPQPVDRATSVIGAITPWLFIAIMHYLHQPWSPILTWSILGGLILISGYDLLRNVLPLAWLKNTWVQEHLVKMMCAYIAITSAFAGTVFGRFMPWAAIIPSALGMAVICGFLLTGPRAWRRRRQTPHLHTSQIHSDV